MVWIAKWVLAVSLLVMQHSGIKVMTSETDAKMTNPDARIVIIGAGTAVLSAAHHLFQNGFNNVTVLEATNRIGGRIHTTQLFEDCLIELGATWIHMIGQLNSMYTLAKSKGLLMKPNLFLNYSKPYCWLTEGGTCINTNVVKKAWNLFDQIEEEMDNGEDISDKKLSCYDYFQMSLNKKMKKMRTKKQCRTKKHAEIRLMFNSIISYFAGEEGDDSRLVSAYHYKIGHVISDNDVVLPGGFIEVLETLQQIIPEAAMKFKRLVTNVNWEDQLEKKARVTCDVNGKIEEYIADHVIITSSLGHLKQYHASLFNPPLPKKKVDAIKRMGFGKNGNIYLYYETPFWKKGDGGIKIVWDNVDDAYSTKSWYKSVFQFSEVSTCPNALLVWVHGDGVLQMETLSEYEVMETCTNILRKFLYWQEIPEPVRISKSSWTTDFLFLGAYSYYSVNSEQNDVADIAEPVCLCDKPVLCFAGEATHEKWFSYTHGARSSGIREAKRIIDLYTR